MSVMMRTGELMRVSSLTPGSTYAFSLSAGNAVGYGPAVKFRVTTLPLRQPAKHQHTEIGKISPATFFYFCISLTCLGVAPVVFAC